MRPSILTSLMTLAILPSAVLAGDNGMAHQSFTVYVPPRIEVRRTDSGEHGRLQVESNINVLVQISDPGASKNSDRVSTTETLVPRRRRMAFLFEQNAVQQTGYLTLTIVPLD